MWQTKNLNHYQQILFFFRSVCIKIIKQLCPFEAIIGLDLDLDIDLISEIELIQGSATCSKLFYKKGKKKERFL